MHTNIKAVGPTDRLKGEQPTKAEEDMYVCNSILAFW